MGHFRRTTSRVIAQRRCIFAVCGCFQCALGRLHVGSTGVDQCHLDGHAAQFGPGTAYATNVVGRRDCVGRVRLALPGLVHDLQLAGAWIEPD